MYNLGLAFERIVKRYRYRPALKYRSKEITYSELNYRANQIAHYLVAIGAKKGDVIGLFDYKSLNCFATIIGCLKIGCIYCVMDGESPPARIDKIVENCSPKHFLTTMRLNDASLESGENLPITKSITGSDPAYIMYTSGSTGFPKGAVMSHANVLNFITWTQEEFRTTPDDVFLNLNPLYFDNSVFDIYASLFSGASLIPIDKKRLGEPEDLISYIDEMQPTTWFSVPSLLIYLTTMKLLSKDNLKTIKKFIFGGEGYPKSKLKFLYDLYSDRAEFINVYGPTECTCICSSYKVTDRDFEDLKGILPLGKMIRNSEGTIEDGELYIRGSLVGLGYYREPYQTVNSFFHGDYKYVDSVYKTGDLVEEKDGLLYFQGRRDQQIKHMGYRIELGEIEAALNSLEYVNEAVALYGEVKGEKQIMAFVFTGQSCWATSVIKGLEKILPLFMIPRKVHIFFEEPLPKNANGKIDRVKLAEMCFDR